MNFKTIMMMSLISIITGVGGATFSVVAMNGSKKKNNLVFEEIYAECLEINQKIVQEVDYVKFLGGYNIPVSIKTNDFLYEDFLSDDDQELDNVWQEYATFNNEVDKALKNRLHVSLKLDTTSKRARKVSGSNECPTTPRPLSNKKSSYDIPVLTLYKLNEHLNKNEIDKAQSMINDRNVIAYVKAYVQNSRPSYVGYHNPLAIESLNKNMQEALLMIQDKEKNVFHRRITNI